LFVSQRAQNIGLLVDDIHSCVTYMYLQWRSLKQIPGEQMCRRQAKASKRRRDVDGDEGVENGV